MKKKTYVLMISEQFPKYHKRAGELTNFFDKIKKGEKIHTIRQNFELWQKRAKAINEGRAILSIRMWSGQPYKSKQVELFQFDKIGVQSIDHNGCDWVIDGQILFMPSDEIPNNDGLSFSDFWQWFKGCPDNLGCIIHFTDFRY